MPTLLNNASATGAAATWNGGAGVFAVVGTFTGATVALEYLGPDGTTWVASAAGLTANGLQRFALPPGQIRASVTGGTPSGLYANAEHAKD
jgi:hypothetical protein